MQQIDDDLSIIQGFPFEFYGETFAAYLASDRQFYIRLDSLCDGIGLAVGAQRRRIEEDDAINDKLVDIPMETPYQETVRVRRVSCLNLRALPYWLGTVDAKRVREDIRPRVILFKRDFAETAWFVYKSEILPPELQAEVEQYATPMERQASELMAEFRSLKRKMDLLSGRTQEELGRLGLTVRGLDERFTALEARVVPELSINSEEARQISEMIKAVGTALYQSGKYGKSEAYAAVQEDFKAQFGIHIYSALPANRMDDAIQYLAGNWKRLKPGQPLPDVFRGHQRSLL